MPDYFALLNEPRQPWLEPDALKQKFLALSTSVHPDRVHHLDSAQRAAAQERYVELNAAYHCLREPRDRLRHLLELERGALPKEIQQIPSDLMDLFVTIGQAGREADAFLSEKAKVVSPLLKVQWFERSQQWTEKLLRLQQTVSARRDRVVQELQQLDREWTGSGAATRAGSLPRLEEIYRLLSYFDRWLGQLHERITQLAF